MTEDDINQEIEENERKDVDDIRDQPEESENIDETIPESDRGLDDPEELEKLYDQFQIEDDESYDFQRIVDHYFDKEVLMLKVNYITNDEQTTTLTVPFGVLKKDVPLELSRYIKKHVMDKRRGGFYNTWSSNTLRGHNRSIRRLYRNYNVSFVHKCRRANVN